MKSNEMDWKAVAALALLLVITGCGDPNAQPGTTPAPAAPVSTNITPTSITPTAPSTPTTSAVKPAVGSAPTNATGSGITLVHRAAPPVTDNIILTPADSTAPDGPGKTSNIAASIP